MTVQHHHQFRNALRRQLALTAPQIVPPGVVTAVNSDGTVQVSIGGDPVPVTAWRLATYSPPTVGDIVHVEKRGNQRFVHAAYANATTVNAETATGSGAAPLPLVQNETAFLDSVEWGGVPAAGTALIPCKGTATVTTSSSGAWTFTFGYPYSTGYAATVSSGAGGASGLPLNQASCTATTLAGYAYTAVGNLVVSTAIVVAYDLLGA